MFEIQNFKVRDNEKRHITGDIKHGIFKVFCGFSVHRAYKFGSILIKRICCTFFTVITFHWLIGHKWSIALGYARHHQGNSVNLHYDNCLLPWVMESNLTYHMFNSHLLWESFHGLIEGTFVRIIFSWFIIVSRIIQDKSKHKSWWQRSWHLQWFEETVQFFKRSSLTQWSHAAQRHVTRLLWYWLKHHMLHFC